jgi:hypothetical protein
MRVRNFLPPLSKSQKHSLQILKGLCPPFQYPTRLPLRQTEEGESEDQLEERRAAESRRETDEKMNEFVASTEGQDLIASGIVSVLTEPLISSTQAAEELVLQGAVLCWSAFEVFARDTFVRALNGHSGLSSRLLEDPVSRRRFEAVKLSIETLALHGFDLSSRMGTVLAEQRDLSDFYTIKAVYLALYPDDVSANCSR